MSADATPAPLARTGCTDLLIPGNFDRLNHDNKVTALKRNAAADLRTEIDKMLGTRRREYSGSKPFQFNKEELALILVALGGPQR